LPEASRLSVGLADRQIGSLREGLLVSIDEVEQIPRGVLRLLSARISASRCYDAEMAKVRTTLTLDEGVLRAVKIRAARTGQGDSEVIESALRRDLGLDLLDRLWDRNKLSEEEAVALAVEAQHATRRVRPR
jgi:hypothetical protein